MDGLFNRPFREHVSDRENRSAERTIQVKDIQVKDIQVKDIQVKDAADPESDLIPDDVLKTIGSLPSPDLIPDEVLRKIGCLPPDLIPYEILTNLENESRRITNDHVINTYDPLQ
jgi:hypothetical protein